MNGTFFLKKIGMLFCAGILCLAAASCSARMPEVLPEPSVASDVSEVRTDATQSASPSEMPAVLENVKITAGKATVYKAINKYGQTLGEESCGRVFKVLETRTDEDGREWYRIYSGSGAVGWITGMNCVLTDDKCSDEALTALLDSCRKGLTYHIERHAFSLDIAIGNFILSRQSQLPARVLCDTDDTPDKNNLLSHDMKWEVIEGEGLKFISVRYTVNLIMLKYMWDISPDFSDMFGTELKNDLARVRVFAQYQDDKIKVTDVSCVMKYDDPNMLTVEPIVDKDLGLLDGPALGMTMQKAAQTLGLDYSEYQELTGIEIDGLTVYLNGSETVGSINVDSGKYTTIRGLKVGDTIETVEKLYGKPDVGFSGDDRVTYQASLIVNGQLAIHDFDAMTVCYKDGFVTSFGFSRIYLD